MTASASMTQPPQPESARPSDPRWPTAADWLARGAGGEAGEFDLAVLGVPAFATSLSPTGAHATPSAVRRQLRRLSTWCESRRIDVSSLAAWDRGDVEDPDVEVEGEWRVRTAAETAAAKAALVFAIGGDNSITAPLLVGAFGDEVERAGLVTLDAHHDIREGRSNGSPVRRAIEAGLAPERIVQVGIADWANSRSYADKARARGITVTSLTQVEERGIDACVREALDIAAGDDGPVYVDLDLDACDRSVAPACPASLPGGLTARQMLQAAWLAGQHDSVRVIDTTEVDATRDPDERTVRLAALCLLEAAAGLCLRP